MEAQKTVRKTIEPGAAGLETFEIDSTHTSIDSRCVTWRSAMFEGGSLRPNKSH